MQRHRAGVGIDEPPSPGSTAATHRFIPMLATTGPLVFRSFCRCRRSVGRGGVTATLGEHGTDDPRGWPRRRLRKVRERELTASLAALGVTEHLLLGLTDGSCARAERAAV